VTNAAQLAALLSSADVPVVAPVLEAYCWCGPAGDGRLPVRRGGRVAPADAHPLMTRTP
jgi:hypothetical protein